MPSLTGSDFVAMAERAAHAQEGRYNHRGLLRYPQAGCDP